MLLSPIQNSAVLKQEWIQQRPYITQGFGEDATAPSLLDDYKKFGLKGHNGCDLRASMGTPLFAPLSGIAKVFNDGSSGYGLHLKIRNKTSEIVLAHLSKINVLDGEYVSVGQEVALSGNSGFSTAPHLHFGLRFLEGDSGDFWKLNIKNYNNGYKGAVDPSMWTIAWKGTLAEFSI